jgi:uncharacterized protein (TIGR03083 family)
MRFSVRIRGQDVQMLGPDLFTSPCGLADVPPDDLGDAIIGAWDDFLAVAGSADLSKPSRLAGWGGREVLIHLGTWPDHEVLDQVVAAARTGGGPEPTDIDDGNASINAAHADATDSDILAALQHSRDLIEKWFEGPEPAEIGRALIRSSVGELPVLSLLSAGCYELAVHALDLKPCGADAPSPFLLQRGLAALMDVTGALSARHQIEIEVTGQTPNGGWGFSSSTDGWKTTAVPPGAFTGPGVKASAVDLLDVSAGRVAIPTLLVSRRLVTQHLPAMMKLSPILSEVPGLPGGAALRAGVGGLSAVTGGVSRMLGAFRR